MPLPAERSPNALVKIDTPPNGGGKGPSRIRFFPISAKLLKCDRGRVKRSSGARGRFVVIFAHAIKRTEAEIKSPQLPGFRTRIDLDPAFSCHPSPFTCRLLSYMSSHETSNVAASRSSEVSVLI